MKCFFSLFFLALSSLAQTSGPRSVYILPMASGFDQYLAGEIVREHVMQVVTDPKAADTVLTDRLGAAFEVSIAKIRPATGAAKAKEEEESANHAFQTSGIRGTVFLVDAASRRVLWSDYQKMSRSTTPGVLHREAARVTKKLAAFTNPVTAPRP